MVEENRRESTLYAWVKQSMDFSRIDPIPGDASFRRYYRVFKGDESFIAVDAPPSQENTTAFVCVAKSFLKKGLIVPEVLAVNYEDGFMLLSDLGNTQLLTILNDSNVDFHYGLAIESLRKLHECNEFASWQLPVFDDQLLLQELNRFHEWYLTKHLKLCLSISEMRMLNEAYTLLISSARSQPYVCIHRDYHSRNLMVLPNNEQGILDFQDAVLGPISYDLVSLLRDCYISWECEKIYQWVNRFWLTVLPRHLRESVSLAHFIQWFDCMGMQRHLKVLGIFARLYLRDQKANYLKDIPRVINYVLLVCKKYPEFKPLQQFLIDRVLPHESDDISSRPWQSDATTY